MARPLRLSFENACYHITSRGNRRDNIFKHPKDKTTFLEKMNETFEKHSISCYAYCLMDNHYHLFLKTLQGNISKAMHYLNTSYSNWYKAKYKIIGVVFQGRYKAILVDVDSYALMLSVYIHLNPIRAKMVERPDEYVWSSYLDYAGKRKPLIKKLDTEFILKQLDSDLKTANMKYAKQVIRNIWMKSPLNDAFKGVAIGREGFIEKIKQKISLTGRNREISETRFAGTFSAEEIINNITDMFDIKRKSIFDKSRNNTYRKLAIYVLKEKTTLTLKEIGEMFDIDYVSVSSSVKRFARDMKKNKKLQNMKTVILNSLDGYA